MKIDVIKRAKRNIIWGTINKVTLLLLPFVQRILIQRYFGSEYIGLSSLFTSIFSILNLSELGLNAAVLSHLYKPIANDDVPQVNALLNFYRKAYKIIGCIIVVLGLILVPFLPHLVKENENISYNLYYLYLIFLFNASIGYFLYSYVSSIFIANQRDDVQSNISTFSIVALNIAQAIVIILLKNFYCFALAIPVFTIVTNLLSKHFSTKLFPEYFPSGTINKETANSIKKLVFGSAINKMCGASRHSLDSIFASSFLGLTLTAYYNNYYMIIAGVSSLISIACVSFTGGIGNHVAYKSKDDNLSELFKLDFMYLWISGCATCVLLCTFQPFMQLWMGSESLLDFKDVIFFCLYFYFLRFGDIRFIYLGAVGLWWENKNRALAEMLSNVILHYLFIIWWGIHGIIVASIISLLIFNHFGVSYILFKNFFGIKRLRDYHLHILSYTLCTAIGCAFSFFLCHTFIKCSNLYFAIILNALTCFVVYNLLSIVFFCRTTEFAFVVDLVKKTLRELF